VSPADVEVVRRIYRAWGKGDVDGARALLDPDVEWVNAPDAVEPGTRRGVDGFTTALAMVNDTFDGPDLEIEDVIDAGEQVVVIGMLRGQGQSSGISVEQQQGYVWTVRDGRAVRFAWFNSAEEALEAAGISR
jgi:uncharacterized protein